jgi:tRNA(Leu) C34 or U34 (ribose-2'-O)-methylase TrmL
MEKQQRGFFGIGIYHPKKHQNCGTLWRSANIFGASYFFTVAPRFTTKFIRQHSDTMKSWRHMPYLRFETVNELNYSIPFAELVAVEITDDAQSLVNFKHPERAIYLLGAEDHGIPPSVLERCQHKIYIPSSHCFNVSAVGSMVMYDRMAKNSLTRQHDSV